MKTPGMRRRLAFFLQPAILLIGLGMLGWMLWEPHLEGRNASATTFEIYCQDPFLAYVYAGSIPFFIALVRAFGLCGDVRRNGVLSPAALSGVRAIGRCGLILLGFVAGGIVIVLVTGDPDDRPAELFMSALVGLVAGGIVTGAALLRRKWQSLRREPEKPRA